MNAVKHNSHYENLFSALKVDANIVERGPVIKLKTLH